MKAASVLLLLLIPLATAQQSLSPTDTTTVSIPIDGAHPIITIHSPQNTTYAAFVPLLVNYSVIEHSLNTIWYSLNGGQNITINTSFSLTLQEGSYLLRIYANDSANRLNFSSVYFSTNSSTRQPTSENASVPDEESGDMPLSTRTANDSSQQPISETTRPGVNDSNASEPGKETPQRPMQPITPTTVWLRVRIVTTIILLLLLLLLILYLIHHLREKDLQAPSRQTKKQGK